MSAAALDIKIDKQIASEAVATIARLGEPEVVVQPAGVSFTQKVASKCGTIDPQYVRAFLLQNHMQESDLASLTPDKTYSYPACAHAPSASDHLVQKGESIATIFSDKGIAVDARALDTTRPLGKTRLADQIAKSTTKLAKSDTTTAVAAGVYAMDAARQFAVQNPKVRPRSLQIGQTVRIPGTDPNWSTVELQAGVDPDIAQAEIDHSFSIGGHSSGQVSSVATAELVGPVDAAGKCALDDADWPFSPDKVEKALLENVHARPPNTAPLPANILVLDTGFDTKTMAGPGIPAERLGLLRDVNFYPGLPRYVGVNLATRTNDAFPPAGLENRWHGAEVGDVAVGAAALPALPDAHVKVAFASVAVVDEDSNPTLSARAIVYAYKFAARNQISVVNTSLYANDNADEFESAMHEYGSQVLFVAAAGNDGHDFGTGGMIWPAAYGGDPVHANGGAVITVGSHDEDALRSPFSRHDWDRVDILAPGCAVATKSADDAPASPRVIDVQRAGTSYSAPLVSFTAALLSAEGLGPLDIKMRILASADVDDKLDSEVYSRGFLNIPKALSVWRDLIEVREGTEKVTHTGLMLDQTNVVTICGQKTLLGSLFKLSFWRAKDALPTDAPTAHVWLKRNSEQNHPEQIERRTLCKYTETAGDSFRFLDSATGKVLDIQLANLIDYVPKSISSHS